MSKLTEYLKLIPKGIKNIDQVVEGLMNNAKIELGTIPQEDLEIIVGRRAICSQCPHNSKNAQAMHLYKTEREDEHCIHCGCPLATLTASLEAECGLHVYNEKNINDKIPLKWEKIK